MDDRIGDSLERMNDYCQRIAFSMHRFGNSFESFDSDYDYQASVIFNLQQIGENAKAIRSWLADNSNYDWNPVCGFRDFIAHSYARVDNTVVWKILIDDFPSMVNELARLLDIIRPR